MADIKKVIKGLEHCADRRFCNDDCPYSDIISDQNRGMDECVSTLAKDALELLKEHKEHEELLTKVGYHWTGNGETLALCKKSKAGEQE